MSSIVAVIQGQVVKCVQCEQCAKPYRYLLKRQGKGGAQIWWSQPPAEKKALGEAVNRIRKVLKEGIDPVPCPNCGWYQAAMIPIARLQHWILCAAIGYCSLLLVLLTIPLFAMFLLTTDITWQWMLGSMVTCTFLGVILLLVHKIAGWRYDPNTLPLEARLATGLQRCAEAALAAANRCAHCDRVDYGLSQRGYCLQCKGDA